jgi:HK97 family phage prohead protease
MPHKTERATLPNTELRVVTAADGTRTVSGLIPYNAKSVDLGGFTELIAPGAFAAAILPDADVLALRDHNSSALLGRTKSGTLSLTDSTDGLRYIVKLPNTSVANDLAESIDRGDLDSTSFGFAVIEDKWTATADEVLRTLVSVELLEVSPCSFPAYPDASVSIRSAPQEIQDRIKTTSPVEVTPEADATRAADDSDLCTCDCESCLAGNCDDCSVDDCDAIGCDCDDDDPDADAADRSRMEMFLAIRHRR